MTRRFAAGRFAASAAALFAALSLLPGGASALPPQPEAYCFAVADSGDNLVFINKDGDGFVDMGPTGTGAMEAIAFNPDDGNLYAVNGDDFGFLDYDDSFDGDGNDSEFIQISADVGSCTLPGGAPLAINDIDGLQFDVTRTDASTGTFVLWATARDGDGSAPDDVLFQIDPATGLVDTTPTPGFTGGATCVRISGPGINVDVDDVAAKPTDGIIYVVNNIGGGTDQLVEVDPVTGLGTVVGFFDNTNPPPATVSDMEGMSFGADGTLHGTTGASGTSPNDFWTIGTPDGETTLIAPFPSLGDYEAVACLTDNLITGTVFFDVDEDGVYEPADGDSGFTGATVRVYIDNNDDGLVDAGDSLLCNNPGGGFNLACPVTDPNGDWVFPVGQGNFVMEVDVATLPAGATLTTDNAEEADFGVLDFGLEDPDNDYGFILPEGSGDLDITKTSDAGGPVVQGQTLTYTLTVQNNSGANHTGIRVTDVLPAGVTYVPQSTVVTGPLELYALDEFGAALYSNRDGPHPWAIDWLETNDDGSPTTGSIDVAAGELRFTGSGGAPLRQIERQVDLTGASAAVLLFDWRCQGDMEAAQDFVFVEVSGNGGASYTTLDTREGEVHMCLEPGDADSGSVAYDISAFAAVNTRIRLGFTISAIDEFFFVDNLEVRFAETFRDQFGTVSYANNDGSLSWATSWLEIGEADGPGSGDIQVTADEDFGALQVLRIRDNDNGGEGVQREADLSPYQTATLSFAYRRSDLDDLNDFVTVEVSGDGGANWVELDRFVGPAADDPAYTTISYDISDFASPTTRVRFLSSPSLGGNDEVYFDDVTISARAPIAGTKDNDPGGANPPDLVDGVPPGLVEPADGFLLPDGNSLTVTFQVTVDNPLTPFAASLLNLAVVNSTESSVPEVARHVDPVVSGALGDRVWLDVDGDGVQDVGEPGLPNVEVTLFDAGADGLPGGGDDTALATALTGMNGEYLFEHLAPGPYFVDVTDATVPAGLVLAPGSTDPSAVFTVSQSEIFLTADFGYANASAASAIIGDYLWNDLDRDGIQDPGEIGIGGVTLELVDLSTGLTVGAPVTTTADGRYLFTGVPPGEYEVRVTDTGSVLSGSSPTVGPQSEGGFVSAPVTVIAGQVVDDLDFGFASDACLPRIDFDVDALGNPIVAGQFLDDEWAAWGVTLSVVANPDGDPSTPPDPGPLMAFDSFNPTGADDDLGSPNETCTPAGPGQGADGEVGMPGENCTFQSNLLIISEDGDQSDPDDSGFGGTITFDFAADVEIEAVEFLDAENTSDSVELFDQFSTSIFFSNLTAPGDNAYELLPVDTAGARQMVVTFPSSGAIAAVDFCLGSLRDKVWLDADGDGFFDILGPDGLPGTGDEETPIAGVTVDLLNASGEVIATTITDAGGNIRFDGLDDGDYTIVITDTDGVLNPYGGTTTPAQNEQLAVTITGGVDVVGVNFGYNSPGTIGDTVFNDPDGDGIQDPGEAGIAGVKVELWRDADGNGIFDNTVDILVGSQMTAADGSYLYSGLTRGTYFASIDDSQPVLAGYTPTTNDEETGPNAPGTQIEAPLVALGDSFLDADFGYRNATLADISGTVFEDLDRDGVEEAGEGGFGGVTVELRDCSGNVLATATTDAMGDYSFPDLPAGCYRVAVTDDFGVLVGYALTSGLDTIEVNLAASDVGDVDFGYVRDPGGASIGDAVWLDENADGIQSAAEAGLSGVTLDLWLDDGDGILDTSGATDTLIATTITDANGEYLFPGLAAGKYFVDLDTTTLPANLTETAYPGGFDPAALTAISEGENYDQADFGYLPDAGTAVLGDRVWYDTDGDGLQDPGEIGIGGVDIQLSGPSCTPGLCTVTTGPDGTWLATGLAPGEYIVHVDTSTLPAGYNTTPTNNGGDDTYTITVAAGDLFAHLDFGFDGGSTGSIGNFVWFDDDGDGVVTAGEIGVEGVTINLVRDTNGNGVIDPGEPILDTVRTDAAGGYTFSGLPLSDAGDGDASDADYLIDVTDIDELLITTNKTSGAADTDNNSQDDPYDVVLTAGSPTSVTADFGYAPSAGMGSIGSQVWHDLDLDGLFEPLGADGLPNTADDESGFEGVTVQLWLDDGDGVFEPFTGEDNLLRSVTTDENGEYEFDGLPASTYFVTVSDVNGVLAGFVQTPIGGPFSCPGADDTSKVDPCIVTLTGGAASDVTADFGYAADPVGFVLSISGTVFEDEDQDALHDEPGEGTVPGAILLLYNDLDGDGVLDPGEPLIGTTISDASGDYLFDNLPPGDYLVAVDPDGTPVEDWIQTTQSGSGGLQPVTLVDADVADRDFGFWSGGFVTTPVTLVGFEATGGGHVTFRWTTATEVGNVGFNIWAVERDGMVRLNDELIPSAGGDSLEPTSYAFEASGVAAETFVLEDRDLFGISRYHGPFELGESRGRLQVERRAIDWRSVRQGHAKLARERALERAATLGSGLGGERSATSLGAPRRGPGGGVGGRPGRGKAPAVRLLVDRESIYRVTYEQLLAAGADFAGVPLDHLSLESQGAPVPVRAVAGAGARSFGPGGYVEFVGAGVESLYTRTNVYRLEARPGGAQVVDDASTASGGEPAYYMESVEVDNQLRYHFAAPAGDPWFEARLLAISEPVERVFPVALEGWVAGAAPVTLRVDMWGLTDFPTAPDHHVEIEVNGLELADEWFDGLVDHPVELEVPDSALSPAANSLKLRLPHDTGADYDLVNYDGHRVTYPRHFRARDGALTFPGSAARAYRVDGLPSPDVVVYRVGEGSVEFASGAVVSGVPGDYSVTFPGGSEPARIHVAAVASLPVAGVELAPERAEITRGRADLVVIAHADFLAGVEPLAQARRGQGLTVRVVDVADVYEQFSFGVVDPRAIKAYLAHAHHKMGAEFALLVGGDTYDYFDYLGAGSMSFIPTPYAQTDRIVHFAPVDSLYADFDSDGIVEMALGRLPVRTVGELERVVAKTLAYDGVGYGSTAVLAADSADLTSGYSFTDASEELRAQLPAGWQTELAYMDDLGVGGARQLLLDRLDEGVALTSYFGHSGPNVWSFENLFNTADAAALENFGRPTVVAQWGCWNTYHVSPAFDTLSHVLMLGDDRGAAAVLGAATLTEASSEKKLGREVFGRIAVRGMPLGRAIVEAKQALGAREPDLLDVLWGWTLLGDPTLVVQE